MKNIIIKLYEYYSVVTFDLGKEKSKFSIQISEELYERYNKAKKEFYDVQLILRKICRENKIN